MPYVIFVYDLISYSHSFRTHHLRHRVVVDDRHLDVADHRQVHRQYLVYLICKEKMMVRHQCVVENLHQLMQDVVHLDVQQNLDEQNLDAIPPFLDEVLQFLEMLQVVVVDVGLLHLLKRDCYLDVVDVELRHLLKMDCFLDEVLLDLELQHPLLHDLLLDRPPHALQLLPY
jgi:hypothetical protein